MDDLVTWLRAQLDENERVARAVAGSGRWSAYREGGYTGDDGWAIETDPGGDPGAIIGDRAMAVHIGLHDPDRVLRGVKADRELLDWATTYWNDGKDATGDLRLLAQAARQAVQRRALAFADRPGYEEEWRPPS